MKLTLFCATSTCPLCDYVLFSSDSLSRIQNITTATYVSPRLTIINCRLDTNGVIVTDGNISSRFDLTSTAEELPSSQNTFIFKHGVQ